MLLMVEEVVEVNQFSHYCNTFQQTELYISVRYNEYTEQAMCRQQDILNIFVVISGSYSVFGLAFACPNLFFPLRSMAV